MKLGFATYEKYPALHPDDVILVDRFATRGVRVQPFNWRERSAISLKAEFDAVIFRSCWDYFRHFKAFSVWLDDLERESVPALNPIPVVRQNMSKTYLFDLRDGGGHIPASEAIRVHAREDLLKFLHDHPNKEWVFKPAISAWGENTFRASTTNADHLQSSLFEAGALWLAQEFLPDVRTDGEWSLSFFGGTYSHAVRKTPSAKEFRIHSEYGGLYGFEEPTQVMIESAREALNIMNWLNLPYARVDLIRQGPAYAVIELEVFEPTLFFERRPELADRFVDACLAAF